MSDSYASYPDRCTVPPQSNHSPSTTAALSPARQPQFIFDAVREMRERERPTIALADDDYDLRPEQYFVAPSPKASPFTPGARQRRSSSARGKAPSAHASGRHTPTDRSASSGRSHDGRDVSETHSDLRSANRRDDHVPGASPTGALRLRKTSHESERPFSSSLRATMPISARTPPDGEPSSAAVLHWPRQDTSPLGRTPVVPAAQPAAQPAVRASSIDNFDLSAPVSVEESLHDSDTQSMAYRPPSGELNHTSDYGISVVPSVTADRPYVGVVASTSIKNHTEPLGRSVSNHSHSTMSGRAGFLKRIFASSSPPKSDSHIAAAAPGRLSHEGNAPPKHERIPSRSGLRPDHFVTLLRQGSDSRNSNSSRSSSPSRSFGPSNSLGRQHQRRYTPSTTSSAERAPQTTFLSYMLGTANLVGHSNLATLGANAASPPSSSAGNEDVARSSWSPAQNRSNRSRRIYLDGAVDGPNIAARDDPYTATAAIPVTHDPSFGPQPPPAVISYLNSSRLSISSATSPDLSRASGLRASPQNDQDVSFFHENSGSEEPSPIVAPRLSRRHQELRRHRLTDSPKPPPGPYSPLGSHPVHSPAPTQFTERSAASLRNGSSETSASSPPSAAAAKGAPATPPPDDGWVVAESLSGLGASNKSSRIWLQSMASDEVLMGNARSGSTVGSTPSLQLETATEVPAVGPEFDVAQGSPVAVSAPQAEVGNPVAVLEATPDTAIVSSADDELSQTLSSEDGNLLMLQLGDAAEKGESLRREYMKRYNLANVDLLVGLRELCYRLPLRGEAQRVDRVLAAFAERWCACNPGHPFIFQGKSFHLLSLGADLTSP